MQYKKLLSVLIAVHISFQSLSTIAREATPREKRICETTGRDFAVANYKMKVEGKSLERALMRNEGAAVYDRITNTIYKTDIKSEDEASDIGWNLCIENFSNSW